MTTSTHTDRPEATSQARLNIEGMTCASCQSRVEKKLSAVPGVSSAVVNLATEKALIRYAAPAQLPDLIAAVKAAGYSASPDTPSPTTAATRPAEGDARRDKGDAPQAEGEPTSGTSASTPHTGRSAHEFAARVGRARRHAVTGQAHVHDASAASAAARVRMIVSIVLTIPVVLLAMVFMDAPASPMLQAILTTPVVLWCALPFHRAAWNAARHGSSTMDTLVSIGVTAAYAWSLATLFMHRETHPHYYFEVAAVVTTFLLIGRFLEARAKNAGRDALASLLEVGAKDVAVLRTDPHTGASSEERIPVGELVVGDRFIVRPGEKIATDGIVIEGVSGIDASLVTGESLPIPVAAGDQVTGGAITTDGRLIVEATKVGGDTLLAGIQRLVEDAQTGKAPIQRLADRVSAVFVPVVLGLAVATLVGWYIATGSATTALGTAISVLVVACPCALGLATPMALLVGSGRGAELGTLIKGPQILEDTRKVDTVVLDKTGTITAGTLSLESIATTKRLSKQSALTAAAAVEQGSEHPIARALTDAGEGASARIKDTEVTVGQAALFERVPDHLRRYAVEQPGTTVFVGWDGVARAAFTMADVVRPTSKAAIARLGSMGLTAYLLTGDNSQTALAAGEAVGIPAERVFAEVKPSEKHDVIARLQSEGKVVAMVGDGINDAAALAKADLGLAMGTGTDVAMDSADIVLVRPDVGAVADAIGLSRETLRTIKQNLAWAFGYNLIGIPLAMSGKLNPMFAGAAMAFSSVLVVLNSLRLRRYGRSAEPHDGPRS